MGRRGVGSAIWPRHGQSGGAGGARGSRRHLQAERDAAQAEASDAANLVLAAGGGAVSFAARVVLLLEVADPVQGCYDLAHGGPRPPLRFDARLRERGDLLEVLR